MVGKRFVYPYSARFCAVGYWEDERAMTGRAPGSTSDPTSPVQPGEVLLGKYRVDRILGAGGIGIIVAAHHLQLDERVAIKFLLPDALQSPDVVARFAQEARAAVKIKSEHVVRVIDVGTLPSGSPYMVMEYLEGADLSAVLSRRGPMPIEEVVALVLQACEALAEAHALGIVHRDLKPANLYAIARADGSPSVKVLDFGISKVTTPGADMGMTKTSAIVGSPLYMSPEQMRSAKSVDARTDIWSIGAILYELLSGQPPFTGESLPELCVNIMNSAPPPILSLRPDLPHKLEAVILRCLEKDRQNRFANIAELAVALAEFAPRQAKNSVERVAKVIQAAGISSSHFQMPEGSVPPPASKHVKTHASWGSTSPGGSTKRAPLFVLLGVGALAIGGAGVWIGARSHGATTTVVTPVLTAAEPARESVTSAPAATPAPAAVTAIASAPAATTVASAESAASTAPMATGLTAKGATPPGNAGRAPAPGNARSTGGARPSRPDPHPSSAPQAPAPASPGDIFQDRQ
jgi:serine/threonine-protein kinase